MSNFKPYLIIKFIKRQFNKKLLLFALFFLMALMLWFANKLDGTYTITLNIPVEYTNIPKSKAIESQLPSVVSANVQTSGLELLKFYVFDKNEVHTIDVASLIYVNQLSNNMLVIKTLDIPEIAEILNSNFKINYINPSDLKFVFSSLQSKKVVIKPHINFSFTQQYQLQNSVIVSPDSIEIFGASKVLQNINFVSTELFSKNEISKSFTDNVQLIHIPNITFSTDKVVISAKVEKFTEQSFTVPIQLENVPDSIVADIMQHSAKVTILVGLSNSSNLQQHFYVKADFNSLNKQTGEIPLVINTKPINARVVKIEPMSVGYIIDKQ